MGTKVFASAINYQPVVPSDSTLVTCKAIYVGIGGNVTIAPSAAGAPITFTGVLAGTFFPIELKEGRVMATNTTATNMIFLGW